MCIGSGPLVPLSKLGSDHPIWIPGEYLRQTGSRCTVPYLCVDFGSSTAELSSPHPSSHSSLFCSVFCFTVLPPFPLSYQSLIFLPLIFYIQINNYSPDICCFIFDLICINLFSLYISLIATPLKNKSGLFWRANENKCQEYWEVWTSVSFTFN